MSHHQEILQRVAEQQISHAASMANELSSQTFNQKQSEANSASHSSGKRHAFMKDEVHSAYTTGHIPTHRPASLFTSFNSHAPPQPDIMAGRQATQAPMGDPINRLLQMRLAQQQQQQRKETLPHANLPVTIRADRPGQQAAAFAANANAAANTATSPLAQLLG